MLALPPPYSPVRWITMDYGESVGTRCPRHTFPCSGLRLVHEEGMLGSGYTPRQHLLDEPAPAKLLGDGAIVFWCWVDTTLEVRWVGAHVAVIDDRDIWNKGECPIENLVD